MSEKINLTLKVWRQENTNVNGDFVSYDVSDVNPHMSFLELLDVLNAVSYTHLTLPTNREV